MKAAARSTTRVAFASSDGQPWREIRVSPTVRGAPQTILVIPGRHATGRVLPISGTTAPQRSAAALAMIGSRLAEPATNCVVAIGPVVDRKALVCVANRTQVEEWRSMAEKANLKSPLIVPDFALLPSPSEGCAIVASIEEGFLIRTPTFACSAPSFLLPSLTDGLTIIETDYETLIRSALPAITPLNFACFPTTKNQQPTRPGSWKRTAAFAAAASALVVATPWISAFRADAAASALRREANEIAATVLPGARRIVDPRAQLAAALAPWRRDSALFSLAVTTLDAVAAMPGAQLERLEADPDEGLTARILVAAPTNLDTLRTRLSRAGYSLLEAPAGTTPSGSLAYSLTIRSAP